MSEKTSIGSTLAVTTVALLLGINIGITTEQIDHEIKEIRKEYVNNDSIPDIHIVRGYKNQDTTYFLGQANGTYKPLEEVKQEETQKQIEKIELEYKR